MSVDVSIPGAQVADLVALVSNEPLELRAELRRGAGESPTVGKDAAVRAVAELLWRSWDGEFMPLGVDAVSFCRVVQGADHEVWLWVMGDRPYEQLVATIAGRVLRRFPSAESGTD